MPEPETVHKPDIPLSFQSFLSITGRTLLSILFLASGTSKLASPKDTQQYMEAYGVPSYLLYPAATLELSTGTMLIVGILLKEVATVLSGWCILTATIFHRDWQGDDGQTQQIMFMKNLCMAGGFIMLAAGRPEGTNVAAALSWAKGKLGSRSHTQADDAERRRLLPKSMPALYLYGEERRVGQMA